jgi:hypothetical protein
MDHLPRYEFQKCVSRYRGEYQQKSSLAGISFWRWLLPSSLAARVFVTSRRAYDPWAASSTTLASVARSHAPRWRMPTRADWRLFADFAQVLIRIARPLYAHDPIGVELDQSLYALDSTTIDLCLSLFPWAKFRKHQAAVKMHTLLDLHGNIPTLIGITDGAVHDVNVLDEILPEAGAFYVMDRGYIDFERLYVFTLCSPFSWCGPKRTFCSSGGTRIPWTRLPACAPIRLSS